MAPFHLDHVFTDRHHRRDRVGEHVEPPSLPAPIGEGVPWLCVRVHLRDIYASNDRLEKWVVQVRPVVDCRGRFL